MLSTLLLLLVASTPCLQQDMALDLPPGSDLLSVVPPPVDVPIIDPAGSVFPKDGPPGQTPLLMDVPIPGTPTGLLHPGIGGHVPPSECRSLIDVMILIDSSDSINAPDFNKLRYAIAHIIPDLDLGPTRIRIGWVVFSTTVAEVQPLSYDKQALVPAAETIIHQREGTMTNLAIAEMIREFDRNGRPNVPRVGILLSDGISKLRAETLKQAQYARDNGTNMFAVGIGLRDNTELFGIASSKDQVVSLENFDSLRKELKKLTKVICPCPEIGPIPFIIVEDGPRSIGSVRNLRCEPGLQPLGNPTLVCQKDSTWSPLELTCLPCPEPMPEFGNAMIKSKGPYYLGDMVTYICYDGYIFPKPIISTCEAGPTGPIWTAPVGLCAVCPKPMEYPFMSVDKTGSRTVGSVRQYMCHKGLVPTGPIEITCMNVDGIPIWTEPQHSCIGCLSPPPKIGHAVLENAIYPDGAPILPGGGAFVGEERYYRCIQGYVETGPIRIICLAEQGTTRWSLPENSCTACLNEPPDIPNAELIQPGGQLIGDRRMYKCLPGFMSLGPMETICEVVKGHVGWRVPAHACIACEEPPPIPNAILDITSAKDTRIGSVKKYICVQGFIQTGPVTIGCVEGPGGPMWLPPEHTCITCAPPPLLKNAILDNEFGNNMIGSIRRYTCDPGYLPIGPGKITIECFGEMTGETGIAIWGPPSDICQGCLDVPVLENAELIGGSNLVGGTMQYKCIEPFRANGPVEVTCLPTGKWSAPEFTCSACSEPHPVINAILEPGPVSIGTTRFYQCKQGFTNVGDLDITCLPGAIWSEIKFECVRCLEPPVYKNAVLEPGSVDIFAVRRYTCEPGYRETGPITTTCTPPKNNLGRPGWSQPVHYCKDCGDPYPVENADIIPGPRTIGSLQRYQCRKGFVPSGPPHSLCQDNAEWVPPNFKCIVCPEPPADVPNAVIQPFKPSDLSGDMFLGRKIGDIRIYECMPGYIAAGFIELVCVVDSMVEYPVPTWERRTNHQCRACVGAPEIPLAVPVGPLDVVTLIGEARTYVCEVGYVQTGAITAICLKELTWEVSKTRCKGCEIEPVVEFGSPIAPVTNKVGSVMTYQCLPGHEAVGVPEVICMENGEWSLPKFQCVIGCYDVPSYLNAVVEVMTGKLMTDTIKFACLPGYFLNGNPEVVCQPDGIWSKGMFTCEACVGAPEIPLAVPVGPLDVVTLIGEARTYVCESGYVQTGAITAICLMDLSWKVSGNRCRGCEVQPLVEFGSPIAPLTNTIGSVMKYQCLAGHEAVGIPEVICMENGEWSQPTFQCVIGCYDIPSYENAVAEVMTGKLHKDTITFACLPGFLLRGNAQVVCMNDGFWSKRAFTCEACVGAPEIPLAVPVGPLDVVTLIGEARTYVCETGYVQTGAIAALCVKDLTWEISNARCKGCEVQPPVEFGSPIAPLTNTIGSIMKYQCLAGHEAVGTPEVFCMENGEWSLPTFQCVIGCYDIPTYENAEAGFMTGHLHKDTITFSCLPGFLLRGNAQVVCMNDGFWSKRAFTCEACVGAPEIPLAVPVGPLDVVTLIGEARTYVCETGYVQTGAITALCVKDLTWEISNARCKGCEVQPPVEFGSSIVPLTNTIGSIMKYQCLAGHEAVGTPEVFCMENGEWSLPTFQCVIGCYDIPSYENAVAGVMTGHLYKDTITFSCVPGFLLRGNAEVVCMNDGFWSKRAFTCEACIGAPEIPLAVPVGPLDVVTLIGEARTYVCETGYVQTGAITALCLKDLTWEISNTRCKGCEVQPLVEFGSPIVPVSITVGSTMQYQCLAGHEAVGTPEVICMENGEWSLPTFQCVIGCYDIPSYENAMVEVMSGKLHKDTIIFKCLPGYLLRGNAEVVCMNDGFWSKGAFTCEACFGAPEIPLSVPVGPLDVVTLIGEARTYVCENGYVQTGAITAVCLQDLTWKVSSTRCKGCEVEPLVEFGTPVTPLTNIVGSVMKYQCLPGYEAVGTPEVYCMENGEWALPTFQCVRSCYDIPAYDDAVVEVMTGKLYKNTIAFVCIPGYLLRGNNEIVCQHDGTWSKREFTCEACIGAPKIPKAIPVGPLDVVTLIGESRTYICASGYVQTGAITAVCLNDLTWKISKTRCRGCETPHPVDFGTPTAPQTNTVGSVLTYTCLATYEIVGVAESHCMENGEWSIPNFRCVKACYHLPEFDNAVVVFGKSISVLNDVITFKCMEGYLLEGNPNVTCQADGQWSQSAFTCRACFGAPDLPFAIPIGPIKVFTLIGETRRYRCENGYIQTGVVMVTCLHDLTWSEATARCRGCEFVPPVANSMPLKPISNVIGSKMIYECLSGYAGIGTPEVFCMENGEWSAPKFECVITCNKPPVFKDAVIHEVSGYHLKSVATYKCLGGGALEGVPHLHCMANGHWSERRFVCGPRDCGRPPVIHNTYCNMGLSIVGSTRRYECNYGYYMVGSGIITCLSTGKWSAPDFQCHLMTTTTTTTPAPVPHNPSVCDRCRMLNAVGFMNHPSDCTQYVQCYYGATGGIVAVYQQCPFGLYWCQRDLTCKLAQDVDCRTERCLNPRIRSYKHSDSARCCAYWECVNGKSVARCCPDGYAYIANKGCEPDPRCSIRQCPYEDMYPGCDKRPTTDMTFYEQHVGAGYWVPMPCAPSTAFSMIDCQCSQHTWIDPGFDCRPELHLDFNDGTITDKSGNNLPIYSENIVPYGGAAYFNGHARLLINRFSNTEFRGHLVIKFRYKEDLRGATAGSLQALVTNGDCGEDPSIIVAKMMGYVLLGSKTATSRTFAMPVVDTEWKDVTYLHDEEQLEGRVCGASYSKYSYGPIRATHCGIQVGYGTKLANFIGLIDDLAIYTCRPPREVLYHYGFNVLFNNNGHIREVSYLTTFYLAAKGLSKQVTSTHRTFFRL